jgi:hypothetical protein
MEGWRILQARDEALVRWGTQNAKLDANVCFRPIADISQHRHFEHMTALDDQPSRPNGDSGMGCVWTILAVNTVLMGFFAVGFPSKLSLVLFLAGSVLPGIILVAARKSAGLGVITASLVWLLMTLFAFAGFVLMAGGGV